MQCHNLKISYFVVSESKYGKGSCIQNLANKVDNVNISRYKVYNWHNVMYTVSTGGAIVATSTIAGVFLCSLLVSMSLL